MTNYCFEAYTASQFKHHNSSKSSKLKFKMESVGAHPEDDDDLDMCPARTRACWPKQIIPWWVASEPDEKPPYSYATLIAHAILSSKDGRLTLNDIYTWIAQTYPAFSVGKGGWQNSIRHNLSLNKKWFCKMERRPTQANPGKGCYWTLVAGTEHIFIDNLTQECGHSRKLHDIGFTAGLSVGQRRGVCYYRNTTESNNEAIPSSSPLYTTFRTMPAKSSTAEDSDNDSGVGFGHENTHKKHPRKRRRFSSKSTEISVQDGNQPVQHVDTSMVHDTPTLSNTAYLGLAPESNSMNFEINHWIESSLIESSKDMFYHSLCSDATPKRSPITIHLGDVTQTYLHFDQELPFDHSLYPNYYDYSLENTQLQQFVSMQDILYS